MQRSTCAMLCLLSLSTACHPGQPSSAVTHLEVCISDGQSDWTRGWTSSVWWVLEDLRGETGLTYDVAQVPMDDCRLRAGSAWSGIGCYGAPGIIYCDSLTLARLGAVSALLAPMVQRWVSSRGPRPSARMARVAMDAAAADSDRKADVSDREHSMTSVVFGWFMQEHGLDQSDMDAVLDSMRWWSDENTNRPDLPIGIATSSMNRTGLTVTFRVPFGLPIFNGVDTDGLRVTALSPYVIQENIPEEGDNARE